ncbi:MAG: hypothetical protein JRJ12_06405 [Deltaproteobacteria bacterium]|nr:hypothetical protein [Deltaproteobacteria bacterium]MBW2071640.1 hypothetical protein [Deltaproteobacteria bacterium]
MINSKLGYCQCGYEVWIEYLWTGKEWMQRFFDLNLQEISLCPDCGREIKEEDLQA